MDNAEAKRGARQEAGRHSSKPELKSGETHRAAEHAIQRDTRGGSLDKLQQSISGSEAPKAPPGTDRGQLTRLDRKLLEVNPAGEARRRELSGRPLMPNEKDTVKRALERLNKKDTSHG